MNITKETSVIRSGRVIQIESLFDISPHEKSTNSWNINAPLEEQPWNIGLIVGPSGSGKSTVLETLFNESITSSFQWSLDKACIDDFPAEASIKDISAVLRAVGFSTIPAWLRPFHTLSNGEQFRVATARTLIESQGLTAIDEWTSVVDRQVAKVASNAVARYIRKKNRQLVLASCHYDIIDWLQPDWIIEPHHEAFEWRYLQRRPQFQLDIYPVDKTVWKAFSKYHYLSASLPSGPGAICYGGFIDNICVCFLYVTGIVHPSPKASKIRRARRIVVLPDWQGLGIGILAKEAIAERYSKMGYRFRTVSASPTFIDHHLRSPKWRLVRLPTRKGSSGILGKHQTSIRTSQIYTFEYIP